MTRLIGVGGRKTAGKDVIADALVADCGWTKLGMSDNLHNCLMILNPIIGRRDWRGLFRIERYRDLVERVGFVDAKRRPEVRRLQQTIGTEVGRDMIDPDVWVKMTARSIRELLDAGQNVVLTGVRYPNELAMVLDLGGETVWVERPGLIAKDGHTSESGLGAADFEVLLINNGTVADLQERARRLGQRPW